MRVLVLGSTGLVGRDIADRLLARGHRVSGVSRRQEGLLPKSQLYTHLAMDLGSATVQAFDTMLQDVDCVVNCAGALQDSLADDLTSIHERMVANLCQALENHQTAKLIHISAIGADMEGPSEFSRSKGRGEAFITRSQINYVIIRPSVIFDARAYGGSALLRGMASLPVYPHLPHAGDLQILALEDLSNGVVRLVEEDRLYRVTVEVGGAEQYNFHEVVGKIRAWLGKSPALGIRVPDWLSLIVYRLGDLAAKLGWRAPIRSNARLEIERGATTDNSLWSELTGLRPIGLTEILRIRQASVQEKWFANLYLMKPIIFGVFGLFWIATGLISLGPGWSMGLSTVVAGGVPPDIAAMLVIAGALADIVIGCAILYKPTSRWGLVGGLLLTFVYVITGTIVAPHLWADPLGPMLKIWPIMVLNLVALSMLDER